MLEKKYSNVERTVISAFEIIESSPEDFRIYQAEFSKMMGVIYILQKKYSEAEHWLWISFVWRSTRRS